VSNRRCGFVEIPIHLDALADKEAGL
jgi:hypothetical protein